MLVVLLDCGAAADDDAGTDDADASVAGACAMTDAASEGSDKTVGNRSDWETTAAAESQGGAETADEFT